MKTCGKFYNSASSRRQENIGLQDLVRRTVGRTIRPNITTKQMETGVYAAADLGEFNATGKVESWAAKMRAWLEKAATIGRCLDLFPELEVMHSAYDVTQGVYGEIMPSSSIPKPADDWLHADKAFTILTSWGTGGYEREKTIGFGLS